VNALTLDAPQDDQAQNRFKFLLNLQMQAAVFMGMVNMGGVDGGSSGNDANSPTRQAIWGGMALLAIGFLVMRSLTRRKPICSFGGWPIALLLTYLGASAFWSYDPVVTVKRTILLGIVVLVCGASVGRGDPNWREDTFSRLMMPPMGLLIALSFLVTVAMPGSAFTDIGWRGIASHKNEAGQMTSYAILVFLYGVCHDKLGIKLRAALIVATFACFMMAKSTTALLGFFFALGLTELIMLPRTIRSLGTWRIPLAIVILLGSSVLFFAFILDMVPTAETMYAKFLDALGKSENFTGRTAIWDMVLGESRFHNPLIGGGYAAFWVGRQSVSGYVLTGGGILYPGQSHNGYVDVYNDLGYVGLGILALLIVVSLVNSIRALKMGHPEARLHLAIVFMCTFLNLGESTFFRGTGLMSIVFIASFIRVSAIVRRNRLESRSAESGQSVAHVRRDLSV